MSVMKKINRVKNAVKEGKFLYMKLDKKDQVLEKTYGLVRFLSGFKARLAGKFGKDKLNLHKEVAFQMICDMDRFDFDAGAPTDFGIRIVIPAGQNLGIKAGDELTIMSQGSTLYKQNYKVVSEANTGDVDAGQCRIVSSTVLRLSDINPFTTESDNVLRIEIQTGERL
jgi:hypothetical protein